MRRREKEIHDRMKIEEVLHDGLVCRIALFNTPAPYIVPVCFVYREGSIVIHAAAKGKKLDLIEKNHTAAFEVETDVEVIPGGKACDFSMKYRSVIGYGTLASVEDAEEKQTYLKALHEKYARVSGLADSGAPASEAHFTGKAIESVCILKLVIEEMTGKRSGS